MAIRKKVQAAQDLPESDPATIVESLNEIDAILSEPPTVVTKYSPTSLEDAMAAKRGEIATLESYLVQAHSDLDGMIGRFNRMAK